MGGWLFWLGQVAIPVVPTVRVVITFTKFVELQPTEQFYTPFSSPRHFANERGSDEEPESSSSSASTSWLRRSTSRPSSASKQWHQKYSVAGQQSLDPFAIPSEYTWSSFNEKNRKMKKSKSTRKAKWEKYKVFWRMNTRWIRMCFFVDKWTNFESKFVPVNFNNFCLVQFSKSIF